MKYLKQFSVRFLVAILFVFLFSVAKASAATYYLAPTGNDSNTCTQTAPCFTLEKAWQIIQAGDTVYLRGGTYAYNDMQYLQGKNGAAGNLIKIWAYPGETPNITRSASYKIVNGVDQDLIYLEGNYFHFKGLEISYFEQKSNETSYPAFRAGFTSYSIFENINYHHNMSGFQIRGNSTGNLILNSDFHHNKDPYGPDPYDGADGLGITFNYDTNSVNTIRGCRAYWNADDGFDTWENQGSVIIENSWAFYNGYLPDTFNAAGNGTAFKLGSISTPSTQTKRLLKNNLAYKNRFAGFVENSAGVKMELYNNTSVNAGYAGYWFGAWSGNGNVTIAKNNLDYLGTNAPGPWNSASTLSNNSWQNNITVSNADFASMDDSQLLRARKSDNSLPDITFLIPVATSDLVNAGTNVGLPYSGSAPDIGAFEYSSATPPPTDTTSPTTPTNLLASVGSSSQINLSWTASTDNVGVTGYRVYRSTTSTGTYTEIGTTATTTYASTGLSVNTQYFFKIAAYDAANNISLQSSSVSATTQNTSSTIIVGDRVQVSSGPLNVRATASTSGTLLGTQLTNALGTVIGGPTAQGGYTWWNINYDTAPDGWSVETYLIETTTPPPNTPPTASAGADQTITLPTNSVTLTGSGTDTGGTITSYVWTKVSTLAGTITSPTAATTTVTGLAQGTHTFRLTVTDNGGLTASDDVNVVVNGTTTPPQTGVYYLSPAGSDSNTCTQTAPCFTLQKAWTLIQPGDTVYLRGGTYTYTKQQGLIGKNGTAGNLIKIWAYPGETPIITRSATGYTTDIYWHRAGIFFTGNYFHFKGIEITGYKNISGNIENGFLGYDASNNLFEQLNIHHNHHGFYLENNSGNNLILNSDFHDNYDTQGNGGNSDGVGISYNTGTNNVIDGCRAWNNGDDGFDTFEAKGLVTIKNSWAWHNGYVYGTSTGAGNGVGFKLGSNFLQGTSLQNTVVRIVQNTISADNRDSGYHINEGDHRTQLYNNVSYANGVMGLNFHWNNLVHTFKNNVSFGNGSTQVEVSSNSISTNNSYGIGGYSDGGAGWAPTASTADFVSTDITQLDNPRQSNGSLPIITAFTLASTSDLINAGTNVGLPYSGSAPDIGAFEYSSATPPPQDTTPPTTTLTAPTNNQTLSGTTTLSATATDAVGVTKVEFYRGTTLLGSDTTSPYTYLWNTTTTANGAYQLSTKAYDAAGNTGTSSVVNVTVNNTVTNTPPTASAGADQTITLPTNSVTLTGSGSDAGGSISAYAWTKVSGTGGTITSPTTATTTITGLTQGTYVFRLTVTDNGGLTASDDVNVVVNAPVVYKFSTGDRVYVTSGPLNVRATPGGTKVGTQPTNALGTVVAGPDIRPSNTWWNVNYDNAPDGWSVETYLEKYVAPPQDTTPPTTTLTAPTNNQTLSGTTTLSATATDAVGVTKVEFYRGTTLLGSDTTSPYTYLWNTTTTANGAYQLSTKAYDAAGNTGTSSVVNVTVNNTTTPPPVGNQINMANVVLDGGYGYRIGGQSFNTLADSVSYPTRSLLRLFENGMALSTPHADHGEINSIGLGRYSHWVDQNGWEAIYFSSSDNSDPRTNGKVYTYTITTANQPPVVNAGADQTITLPTNSVTLTGVASDPEGNTMTYVWSKISGTGGVITSPNSLTTTITGLTQGTYSYWLTVTDSLGGTNADQIVITVNNQPSSFSDTFNRANGTDLGANWTERYGASNFRINTNKLQLNINDGQVSSAHTTSGITSANYTIQSKISFPTRDSIMYAGLSGRRVNYGATDSEGYMAFIEPYDSLLTLYKRVAGQWTRLGEYQITISANVLYTIGLSMNGTSISALWNGSPVISVTDMTFSQAGSAGAITGDGHSMTPIAWDDITISSQ